MERRSCLEKDAGRIEADIIKQCKKTGKKWTDPDFRAVDSSICSRDRTLLRSVDRWERASEILDNPSLFVDGVESGDVIQGELGDCWFLGAMSVVATRNDLLYPLFISAHPEYGFFQIKFYKNGAWRVVTIDDYLPVKKLGSFKFGHCADRDEYWVPLMEKAFAKLNGCYENNASGNFSEGMTDLTGEGCETFSFKADHVQDMIRNGTFWKLLMYFEEEAFLMGCSMSGTGVEKDMGWGILSGHAYAVLRCVETKDKHGRPVKLMQIRNPWGQKEWTGAWSDGSKEWTPALMKQLDQVDEDDGAFWMCYDDWLKHYNTFAVCRLLTDDIGKIWQKVLFEDSWTRATAGGCCNNRNWNTNHQYWLKVPQPTKCFFHLAQEDGRSKGKPKYSSSIGVYIFQEKDLSKKKMHRYPNDAIHTPTFVNSREYACSFDLDPGTYILMPCTFDSGKEHKYFLNVYSEDPVDVGRIGGAPGKKVIGAPPDLTKLSWLNRSGSTPVVKEKDGPPQRSSWRKPPPVPSRSKQPPPVPSRSNQSKDRHANQYKPKPTPTYNHQKKSPTQKKSFFGSSKPKPKPTQTERIVNVDKQGDRTVKTVTTRKVDSQGNVKTTTKTTTTTKKTPVSTYRRPPPTKRTQHTKPANTYRPAPTRSKPASTGIFCKRCLRGIKAGEKYVTRNGKTYCQKHAYERCKGCKNDIQGGKILQFKGKKYHTHCFKCSVCRTALGTQFYQKNGKPVCSRHK